MLICTYDYRDIAMKTKLLKSRDTKLSIDTICDGLSVRLARGLHSTKTGTSLFCVTSGMGWRWGGGGLKTHQTIK